MSKLNYKHLAQELLMVIEDYESKGIYFDWSGDFGNEIGRIIGRSFKDDTEAIIDFVDGVEHGIELEVNK